jgi:hypothetical protein
MLPYRKIPKRIIQFLIKPIRPLFENQVHTIRSGPSRGLKRRGGFSFIPTRRTTEDRFLETLDLRGKTIFDVGANIGGMSLYFARAVGAQGRVHA